MVMGERVVRMFPDNDLMEPDSRGVVFHAEIVIR
jgi:hypothetical protein